jgi:hypothetical protein
MVSYDYHALVSDASFVTRVAIPERFSLVCVPPAVICRSGSLVWVETTHPTPGLLISQYPPSSGLFVRKRVVLPSFRIAPVNTCPMSRTPVVSCRLAKAPIGLLPSAEEKASALGCVGLHLICSTTTLAFSGLNHTACVLAPSSFRCPLRARPVELAPDPLARLWSGGTEHLDTAELYPSTCLRAAPTGQ